MKQGCYTALITPFEQDGIDYQGVEKLIEFQIENGISGILIFGTTGESPTIESKEQKSFIDFVGKLIKDRTLFIAGTGSNNTAKTLKLTEQAIKAGADAALLVDPYYNGPSSLEIRKEYILPVAKAFPQTEIIPYIIPGRTGTKLFAEDLALLKEEFPNIKAVKEATGDFDNMKKIRYFCSENFSIFSGDDANTYKMMTDPDILAAGVISVISNIAPKAIADMVNFINKGEQYKAKTIAFAMAPLFNLVTFGASATTPYGEVFYKFKNPLPIKTAMNILGMPAGGCRRPLGKMTKNGVDMVIRAIRKVHAADPEILKPIANFFNVDIIERINNSDYITDLFYS